MASLDKIRINCGSLAKTRWAFKCRGPEVRSHIDIGKINRERPEKRKNKFFHTPNKQEGEMDAVTVMTPGGKHEFTWVQNTEMVIANYCFVFCYSPLFSRDLFTE